MERRIEHRLFGSPETVSIGALVLRGTDLVPKRSRINPETVVGIVDERRRSAAPALKALLRGELVPGVGAPVASTHYRRYGNLTMAVLHELHTIPFHEYREQLKTVYQQSPPAYRAAFRFAERQRDLDTSYQLMQGLVNAEDRFLPATYRAELQRMIQEYNRKPIDVALLTHGDRLVLAERKQKLGSSIIEKLARRLTQQANMLGVDQALHQELFARRPRFRYRQKRKELPPELFDVSLDDAFGARFTLRTWEDLQEYDSALSAADDALPLATEEFGVQAREDYIYEKRLSDVHQAIHTTHCLPVFDGGSRRVGPDHVEMQLMPAYAKLFDHLHERTNRFVLDMMRHEERPAHEKNLYLELLSYFERRYAVWSPHAASSRGSS